MVNIGLYFADRSLYEPQKGITVYREFGKTPNGNEIGGRWVYRKNGKFIDVDTYQSDLLSRNNLHHISLEY